MTVRIVTDSTSDIDDETARELGIAVVPQNVHFDTLSFQDIGGVAGPVQGSVRRVGPGQRWDRVHPHLLQDQRRLQLGPTGIPGYSGGLPVEVIETGQAYMGLGPVVLAAEEAAVRGPASLRSF